MIPQKPLIKKPKHIVTNSIKTFFLKMVYIKKKKKQLVSVEKIQAIPGFSSCWIVIHVTRVGWGNGYQAPLIYLFQISDFFYLFFSCGMWDLVPEQRLNLSPLHWEYGILGNGPPGGPRTPNLDQRQACTGEGCWQITQWMGRHRQQEQDKNAHQCHHHLPLSWRRQSVHLTREITSVRTEKKEMKLRLSTDDRNARDFPGGPVVGNSPCNARDTGLIPDQGTNIPHSLG